MRLCCWSAIVHKRVVLAAAAAAALPVLAAAPVPSTAAVLVLDKIQVHDLHSAHEHRELFRRRLSASSCAA